MKTFFKSPFILFTLFILTVQLGCKKDTPLISPQTPGNEFSKLGNDDVNGQNLFIATTWIDLILKVDKTTTGWNGVDLSRALGYTGIAMYQSLLPSMPGHSSLVGQLNELTSLPEPNTSLTYSWPVACNTAIAQMVRSLFANTSAANFASIDSLEDSNNANFSSIPSDVFNRSVDFGTTLANAVFDYSKTDGGDQAYNNLFPSSFIPPVGDQYWKPTGTQGPIPLLPYWGNNRPLIAGDIDPSLPPAPLNYSTDHNSGFYKEAYNVYRISKHLTPEQSSIALFWNDGAGTYSSVGHSFNIFKQVLILQNSNLKQAVVVWARLGIAINDAVISCFKTKYTYNLVRPITYIQQNIDASWATLIATPAFPEYTSGHSCQSGAMETILTAAFGDHYAFTDYSHEADGLGVRSFGSFKEAAYQAGMSRVFGGIHYERACKLGLIQGAKVANAALALNL